jgi:hypothetical protein
VTSISPSAWRGAALALALTALAWPTREASGQTAAPDPAPAAPAGYDLHLTAGQIPASLRAGAPLAIDLSVLNRGYQTSVTLTFESPSGSLVQPKVTGAGCEALPCTFGLQRGEQALIHLEAVVTGEGTFGGEVRVAPSESDETPQDNVLALRGLIEAPPKLGLTANLGTAGPFRENQQVRVNLTVRNDGGQANAVLGFGSDDGSMEVLSVAGACSQLPCAIALAEGSIQTVAVDTLLKGGSRFAGQARLSLAASEDVLATAAVEGLVDAPPPDSPLQPLWRFIRTHPLIVFLVLSLTAAAAGGSVVQRLRKASWRGRLRFSAAMAPDFEGGVGAFDPAVPPLGVDAWLEPGEAGSLGPIPVKEVSDA